MKKNGFAFIETIITVVILSASLIFIYSSYNAVINEEEKRIYYDDVAYIYKTNYVKRFLQEYSEIESIKNYAFPEHTYIVTIGSGYDSLFKDSKMNDSLESIINNFHINQMVLLKSQMFDDCIGESDYCNQELEKLSYNMRSYVNTLDETDFSYYLVVEYAEKYDGESSKYVKCTPGIDTNCTTYYVSLGVESISQINDGSTSNENSLANYIKGLYTMQGANNLYYHNGTLENGINDGSYRYAGSYETTNNWVCFGSNITPCPYDNLYRIIGVFNEKNIETEATEERVKLIKAYEAGEITLGASPQGTASKNSKYYRGELSSIPGYSWSGNSAVASNNWENSTLNTNILNGTYLTKLGNEWSDKIAVTEWSIGGNTYNNIITSTPAKVYQNEKISPAKNTKIQNKVGLMYASDYGFISDIVNWGLPLSEYGKDNNKNNNWIFLGFSEWLITSNSSVASHVIGIGTNGNGESNNDCGKVGHNSASASYAIRPTFYLNTDVKFLGGSGTQSDPYRIN